jgi:hypothetical protein
MTITDYRAEAAGARRTSAKCYRRARRLEQDAQSNLKTAANHDWLAKHADREGEEEEAAQYRCAAAQLRKSAAHYLEELAPHARELARDYTTIARRYDRMTEEAGA